jgi:hypothetical protein
MYQGLIKDSEVNLEFSRRIAKYQDLYSSPANIVWLREYRNTTQMRRVRLPDEDRVRKVYTPSRTTCRSSSCDEEPDEQGRFRL